MGFLGGLGRWASASNEAAIGNARAASTALSRLRVEREEVELFVRERYAREVVAGPAGRPTDARVARVAR